MTRATTVVLQCTSRDVAVRLAVEFQKLRAENELWIVFLPQTIGHCYQNFPDPELTDWAAAYYGENLTRHAGLRFQSRHGGGDS